MKISQLTGTGPGGWITYADFARRIGRSKTVATKIVQRAAKELAIQPKVTIGRQTRLHVYRPVDAARIINQIVVMHFGGIDPIENIEDSVATSDLRPHERQARRGLAHADVVDARNLNPTERVAHFATLMRLTETDRASRAKFNKEVERKASALDEAMADIRRQRKV